MLLYRFVYFGYDYFLPAVERLCADGHALQAVFSFPCDNFFNFNTQTQSLAERRGTPFVIRPPEPGDIETLTGQGCTLFLCAGYPYKIPPIDAAKAYGLNLHPAYLPQGRGIMPTPWIFLKAPEAAGFTLHKLSPHFDAGDILCQERLPLSPDDTVETYSARVAIRGEAALREILADLPATWDKAKPQNPQEAVHFPMPTDAMRMLDWNAGIVHIRNQGRAFGRFGCLAALDGESHVVYQMSVWPEEHAHEPGTIIRSTPREVVVAARGGFVCLTDVQPLD